MFHLFYKTVYFQLHDLILSIIYDTGQRYGEVVGMIEKVSKDRNGRTHRQKFLKIIWDGTVQPCEHAQMRICHESEIKRIVEEYCTVLEG